MEVKLAGLCEEKERSIKTGSQVLTKIARWVVISSWNITEEGQIYLGKKKRSLVLGNKDEIL